MSFKHIDPARGYYILEAVEDEKTTTFAMVQDNRDMPQAGKIVGVGGIGANDRGELSFPPEYEMGDVIVFPRYTDNKMKLGGKEFTLVKFKDVMGKLKEAE